MRRIWALALALGLGLGANDPQTTATKTDQAEKQELDRVTGVWAQAGDNVPPENAKARLIYRGREFEGKSGERVLFKGHVKLDPTKTPKELDLTVVSGPNQERTMLGVYELDAQTYRGCLAAPGKPRPATLTPEPGSGQQAFAFRRLKESADPTAAAEGEYQRFEGAWAYASVVSDGQPIRDPTVVARRLILNGDQFQLTGPATSGRGTYSVDPKAVPKTIDVTFSDGLRAGKTMKGIYELAGDTCTVCMASGDQPRPTRFESKAHSGHTLEVLKRVKP
jgi:uncharacterized protein (TIGR03067 family)